MVADRVIAIARGIEICISLCATDKAVMPGAAHENRPFGMSGYGIRASAAEQNLPCRRSEDGIVGCAAYQRCEVDIFHQLRAEGR